MKPWLCLLPTKTKVLETSSGRVSKPFTASDPAPYRLMMLTLRSFSSCDSGIESGPSFPDDMEYAETLSVGASFT
jgi:hypothetical protein